MTSDKRFSSQLSAISHAAETAQLTQLTQLHFSAIMYAMRRDLTLAWNYTCLSNNWQKISPFITLVFQIYRVLLIS